MSSNTVAIVILNFNGKKHLETFLPSVMNTSYAHATIIIADNGSTDDSLTFLAANYPDITCLKRSTNEGFAGGYNWALSLIDANYYMLLNSDVEVTPNWLEPMVTLLDSDSHIAACQPKILSYHNKDSFEYAGASGGWIDALGYPFSRGRIFDVCEKDDGQYNHCEPIFWATGASLFIRASCFKQVGGLDESFFAHQEEIDLCWRLQRAGYQIAAVAESQVLHVGGGTLAQGSPFKTYLNFRNNLILLYKNVDPALKFNTIFKRMLLDGIAGIRFLLDLQWKQFLAVVHAHFYFYKYVIFHKNKQNLPESLQKNYIESYPGNIVVDYFFRKIKKFSDLKF